jgi:hypothetical protein
MQRAAVRSSSIASVGHDEATSVLEVELANGAIYKYFVVPRGVLDNFLSSDSPGRFFVDEIRGRFSYECVRPQHPGRS